jgi:hypothetical protein
MLVVVVVWWCQSNCGCIGGRWKIQDSNYPSSIGGGDDEVGGWVDP